jgi:hypothetical protein
MAFPWTDVVLRKRIALAVGWYWQVRASQSSKQQASGEADAGLRREVTGGQHMDGFADLVTELVVAAGFKLEEIRLKSKVELPGYFRSTKKWDLVVTRNGRLCCALELKSQAGPSFGNNFNNRTEEALGTSVDFWKAFEKGFIGTSQPWLGYLFLLEDCAGSSKGVRVASTPFKTDPVFATASYAIRYQILCERMVLERHYSAATLLLCKRTGAAGYTEPNDRLSFMPFARALYGHLVGCS